MSEREKQCRRCGELLPATIEFFYRDRSNVRDAQRRKRGEVEGLRDICKACYSETPCILRRNAARRAA